MKLAELFETKQYLYKAVSKTVINQLEKTGRCNTLGTNNFYSTCRNIEDLKSEFGSYIIKIDISKLPKRCKVIDIQYDFDWFTKNQFHKDLLMYVTSRSREDWLYWAESDDIDDKVDEINNELESIYGEEKEVVITNVSEISFDFCDIVNRKVNESLDSKIDYEVVTQNKSEFKTRCVINGRSLQTTAEEQGNGTWTIDFSEKLSVPVNGLKSTFKKTGSGKELQVFSFVKSSIEEFIQIYHPETIEFSGDKDEGRIGLYAKMIERFAGKIGYELDALQDETFVLKKK